MKLYDYTLAPNPKRVRIFLAEKGVSVPTVQVDLRGGEQFTPEFRAINPECTVPVLEFDDGRRIAEVIATCLYFELVPALAERGRARVARFFEMMDRELVGREYVAGDRYTIADIMALVTVNFAARIDLKVPEGCVHLRRWHQAVNARPSADA